MEPSKLFREREGEKFNAGMFGGPPYGYRAEDGVLVSAPRERSCIGHICNLMSRGRRNGRIASSMCRSGYLTRTGNSWTTRDVRRIASRIERGERI